MAVCKGCVKKASLFLANWEEWDKSTFVMRNQKYWMLSILAVVALAGCDSKTTQADKPSATDAQVGGTTQTNNGTASQPDVATGQTMPDSTAPAPAPQTTVAHTDPTPKPTHTAGGLQAPANAPTVSSKPYGIRVQGKPGFVTSPHSPASGLVDVRDPATNRPYTRGTEVKCPYSGKIFLVP